MTIIMCFIYKNYGMGEILGDTQKYSPHSRRYLLHQQQGGSYMLPHHSKLDHGLEDENHMISMDGEMRGQACRGRDAVSMSKPAFSPKNDVNPGYLIVEMGRDEVLIATLLAAAIVVNQSPWDN